MRARQVLVLAAGQLAAYRVAAGTARHLGDFSATPAGQADFANHLARWRGDEYWLLVDSAEENLVLEDIPPGLGRDRVRLVRRKLARRFPDTPYVTAIPLKNAGAEHGGERLLLMALTRPDELEPWLGILRAAKAVLASMHTPTQILAALTESPPEGDVLVVAPTRAGLRQILLKGGQPRFARLCALPAAPDELAAATARECARLHPYLHSQRLLAHGTPLTVLILTETASAPAWNSHCRDGADLRFVFLAPSQAARRAGLIFPTTRDRHIEILLCLLLAHRPPEQQLAPPAARVHHRLRRIGLGLNIAAGVLCALGLGYAAVAGEALRAAETGLLRTETLIARELDERAAAATAADAAAPSSADMRASLDRHEALWRRVGAPDTLLLRLSRSLDAFPHVEIDRIEWEMLDQNAAATARARVDARLSPALAGDSAALQAHIAAFVAHLDDRADSAVLLPQATGQDAARRFSIRLVRAL